MYIVNNFFNYFKILRDILENMQVMDGRTCGRSAESGVPSPCPFFPRLSLSHGQFPVSLSRSISISLYSLAPSLSLSTLSLSLLCLSTSYESRLRAASDISVISLRQDADQPTSPHCSPINPKPVCLFLRNPVKGSKEGEERETLDPRPKP